MTVRTYVAAALIILTSTLLGANAYGHEGHRILSHKVDQLFTKWNKPDSPGAAVVVLSNLGLGAFSPMPLAMQVATMYLTDQLAPVEKPFKEAVKIDPNVYDAYLGKYVLPLPYTKPKIVTIVKENDRLKGQLEGQPRDELLPESEDTFFVKDENTQIIFFRDENGQVNRFTARINDWQLPLPARRLHMISADELEEFSGDFNSRELSTTWTMVIQNSQLWAKHKSQQDVRLFYTGAGRFTGDKWRFQEIAFTRDKTGRITGFRLSTSFHKCGNVFS